MRACHSRSGLPLQRQSLSFLFGKATHGMKATTLLVSLLGAWCCVAGASTNGTLVASTTSEEKLVPIPLKLPAPSFGVNGPVEYLLLVGGPHLEPRGRAPRPPFLAPPRVTNVALHKQLTVSDNAPHAGSASLLTDGNKEAEDENVFEMHRGKQWVQIDLGELYRMYAIVLWHDHRYHYPVYHGVVVMASDRPDLTTGTQILFNNDYENTQGFGPGRDLEYFETFEGKLMDPKGAKARYLRFYSNGNSRDVLNAYTEIEVYGLPAK